MLDIAFIRQNQDVVRAAIQNKRCDVDLDALLEADRVRRDAITEIEKLRARKNEIAGAIPKASCREQVFFRIKGQKGLGDADSRFTYIRLHRRRVSASFSVRAGNFRRRRPSHEPGR